jgi:hypothetical protein
MADNNETQIQVSQAAVPAVNAGPPIPLNMETVQGFEALQRAARLFASSDLVPKAYQRNIPNTTIALAAAMRLRADPLMVLQNLHIIHGRPSWSSPFLIAAVNNSGRFTPLRFTFTGVRGQDSWGCRASAKDLRSQEVLEGTEITIGIAKQQGWYGREGSKWSTGMAEQMLRYRAASWWVRVYAPEISMGFMTREEVEDDLAPAQAVEPEPPHQIVVSSTISSVPPPVATVTVHPVAAVPDVTPQTKVPDEPEAHPGTKPDPHKGAQAALRARLKSRGLTPQAEEKAAKESKEHADLEAMADALAAKKQMSETPPQDIKPLMPSPVGPPPPPPFGEGEDEDK